MKAIYDNTRAIDLLQSLPEVDPNRIGCIGHSLGGHNTLFTAVFDERIKAAVTSCGFTSFHKYKGGDLTGWTSPRYMPLIKTKYKLSPDQVPFDFAEVIAAIAPRAVFVNAPLHDDNFDISGVHDVLNAAAAHLQTPRPPRATCKPSTPTAHTISPTPNECKRMNSSTKPCSIKPQPSVAIVRSSGHKVRHAPNGKTHEASGQYEAECRTDSLATEGSKHPSPGYCPPATED